MGLTRLTRLTPLMLLGWLAWMSPVGGGLWTPIGSPFETKELCVEMLFAAARAQPDWLNEMQITCRPVGTNPNGPQPMDPSPIAPGQGL